MTLTLKQKEEYYRRKAKAEKIILRNAKQGKHIVYGARSVNVFLPKHLEKHTEDWDIFSKTPIKTANKVEKKLDKSYGGDYFETKPALHPGTHKVINKVTKRGVADYSKPDKKVPYVRRKGVRYAKLEFQKGRIKMSLSDPKSKFRHEKDKETRQRIRIYELQKKKRRKPTRSRNMFAGAFTMPKIYYPKF